MQSKETNLKEVVNQIIKDNDKPRQEPVYCISPQANKIFEDTLRELYPNIINANEGGEDITELDWNPTTDQRFE